MYIVATFYVVVVDLRLESKTLSLFFGALVFHLLYIGLIKFFCLQEFNCLHFDWPFFCNI